MKISPLVKPLLGVVALPGDKSMSHRALMFASLCQSASEIRHFGQGADNQATVQCLRALGVRIDVTGEDSYILPPAHFTSPRAPLDCMNSGTTMRLLMGLLAGQNIHATLIGDESLSRRPMSRVVEPLAQFGAQIKTERNHAPIEIFSHPLHAANVSLKEPSAQVKSSVMLAALFAENESTVVEPEQTRDHSERMMQAFGFPVRRDSKRVHVGSLKKRPEGFSFWVPADVSSAAFWVVLATLVPGSDVTIIDVGLNPTRLGFVDVLKRMGASIEMIVRGKSGGETWGDLRVRAVSKLLATNLVGHEARLAIDEIVVLAVAMAFAQGRSCIAGVQDLRHKESDRIESTAAMLRAAQINVEVKPDGLVIDGGRPQRAHIDAHGDHRIALAAAVLACAGSGAEIDGFDSASVSYGNFLPDVRRLSETSDHRGHAITVAIDGPAGAGKSTVARLLSQRLGYVYVDTGAIYRALAWLALREGIAMDDREALTRVAKNLDVRFESTAGQQRVLCGDEDVTTLIRTPQISQLASVVSQHPDVRQALLDLQRRLAGNGGAVLEGRDIGTVVFPSAQAKFFLDAAPHERARRRYDQLGGDKAAYEEVLRELSDRDQRDKSREAAPLKIAVDAVCLDSTALDVAQVVNEIERRVRAKERL